MSYNRREVAERLADLRNPYRGKISLSQLSLGIEEKTGVSISTTQLMKYENPDESNVMSVENMMAIADYYGVSYDYLLGYSNSKKRENHDISEEIGLSDEAVDKLKYYNKENDLYIDMLNFLLENKNTFELVHLVYEYVTSEPFRFKTSSGDIVENIKISTVTKDYTRYSFLNDKTFQQLLLMQINQLLTEAKKEYQENN